MLELVKRAAIWMVSTIAALALAIAITLIEFTNTFLDKESH